MKKSLSHTRVSVKLRKAEFRKEWYLYIESYPVISKNGGKPQRVREYVNRTITTPIWDKSRTARTASDGSVTYKPKLMSMVLSFVSRSLTKNHASMQTRSGLLDKRNTIPQDFILNQKPPYWNRKRNRNAILLHISRV